MQQFMLTVRSSGQNQFYPIVSFFSNFASTSVLIIIVAFAIWQYFQRIINAVWVIFVHFSSMLLALLINWISQELHLNGYPALVLINEHVLATVIIILIVLTIILPTLVDQEVQLLTILLAFLWLGMVITAQLYGGRSSFTGMLASLLVALVWWEIMRIFYFICDF
ncbi:hypothetical protein FD50_GL000227 [Liquorilactobacillus satsumensis DSM 16230 = JCM 12392]|uniref:Uncharacterized protein n=2 Tax=Lactobacillales TaxID=186826 RepID=A0A0R1V108_9LACO|nr:hypothetical protein FD50_GL000227 [Liquorilactobacillus satsumensis DSM 16230 = JCM 12392]